MAYNDELGYVLDRMTEEELKYFAIDYLKISRKDFVMTKRKDKLNGVRLLCSKEFRASAGYLLTKPFRNEHELPYIKAVQHVASKLDIDYQKDDNVIAIEKLILDYVFKQYWKNLSDKEKEDVANEVQKELEAQNEKELLKKVRNRGIQYLIEKGLLASSSTFMTNALGYNLLQTLIFKQLGIIGAGKALLGIGIEAIAINLAKYIAPAIGIIYTIHQISKPPSRIIVPSVIFIAMKRIELEKKENMKKNIIKKIKSKIINIFNKFL